MNSGNTHRACESCRLLKVKCQPVPIGPSNGGSGKCRRCTASGNPCIYTASLRNRRKRTDVKVRELEREVKQLGDLLRKGNDDQQPQEPRARPTEHQVTSQNITRQFMPSPSTLAGGDWVHEPDVVDQGLLSIEYASQLLERYNHELAPQRPLVTLPSGLTVDDLRKSKPTLFVAVMAVASATLDEVISTMLMNSLLGAYAQRIMMKGEKSLELIQALLVSTNWYYGTESYDQLKLYQQLHMAATMVIDMGLGTKQSEASGALASTVSEDLLCNDNSLERARALLGCYVCCSSISLGFGRSSMFPFSEGVAAAMKVLEEPTNCVDTDGVLIAWVTLQHIIDTSATAMELRDNREIIDFGGAVVQLALQTCAKRLTEWRNNLNPTFTSGTLLMQYHYIQCLVHEPCLYNEFDPADFKPPYSIRMPRDRGRGRNNDPALSHLTSVLTCISSSHSMLELFFSFPATKLRCSPVVTWARVIYGVITLLRIHVSAVRPEGILNGVLTVESVKFVSSLERVMRKLEDVCSEFSGILLIWHSILSRVNKWFRQSFEASCEGSVGSGRDLVELLRQHTIQEDSEHRSTNLTVKEDQKTTQVQPRQLTLEDIIQLPPETDRSEDERPGSTLESNSRTADEWQGDFFGEITDNLDYLPWTLEGMDESWAWGNP